MMIMSKAEWMSGKYGIMVHFLSHINGIDGTKKLSPDEMAEAFDVKKFASQVQKMGASWVIFPFGQNTGYYWSENPVIEELIPGRCTKRDLMSEIADELTARNIRLIAYIPSEADAQAEDIRTAFGWDLSSDKKVFMERYTRILKYYAEKLGKRLSGWWFDGCYDAKEKAFLRTHDWSNDRFNREEWFAAAKAGNPDAVIAMNPGANMMEYVYEEEEYLGGEANDLVAYPWDYASREKQWHVLTWLDCFWMLNGEGAVMPNPRFTNKELYSYVKKCTDMKGAVTLNIGIYEDGTLAKKTVEQVCGLKTVVGNDSYSLFNSKYYDVLCKFNLHMRAMHDCLPFENRACKDGHYYAWEPGCDLYFKDNWMTSFITGLAPVYYQNTPNSEYLKWANGFRKYYHNKMFETPMESMHDIGFLYSPYSVAMYKLTGDKSHREDALKAADELTKRFDIKGGYIDAWGRMDDDTRVGRAIIDCMMNLALLLWAWKETKHTYYRDIALSHAEVTRRYFIRDDYSVAHSYDFDRKTGECVREHNDCGYSNGSWWARGTAWAVYGYSILADYTDSDEYRELAENIAKAYISQLPKDSCVPVWDFRLPKEKPAKKCGKDPAEWDETKAENCEFNVDTSAAAIMACGLICLYEQTDEKWMIEFVLKTMKELSSDKYMDFRPEVEGILSHQNGQMTYTTFGDYFYVEALSKILFNSKNCWQFD